MGVTLEISGAGSAGEVFHRLGQLFQLIAAENFGFHIVQAPGFGRGDGGGGHEFGDDVYGIHLVPLGGRAVWICAPLAAV